MGSDEGGASAPSLVQFSIGPVQGFIEAARSVRDLWTGSYILSWLAAHGMAEAIRLGGTLSSPKFHENPLVQFALGMGRAKDQRRLLPCLPNTFSAEFACSGDEARAHAQAIERRVRREWEAIACAVLAHLDKEWHGIDWNPIDGWSHQIGNYWDFAWAGLPREADVEKAARSLRITVAGGDREFRLRRELLGRAFAAKRMIRRIPDAAHQLDTRPKCALLGTEACMGPLGLAENQDFWSKDAPRANKDGERLQKRDRFGAVALAKRFAWSQYFAGKLGVKSSEKRMWDTATIAAAGWLREEAGEDSEMLHERVRSEGRHDWSGQWLHQRGKAADDEDVCPSDVYGEIAAIRERNGGAPTYYAMLMLDGDGIGEALRNAGRAGAEALSGKLQEFALNEVGAAVKRYLGDVDLGQPVYAGGDDVLAMLPARMGMRNAADCAADLQRVFADKVQKSLSGALVLAHYKANLREVLEAARDAEKAAKEGGRNRLVVAAMRRSGEHSTAHLPWDCLQHFSDLVEEFAGGKCTDRWVYQLRAVLDSGALSNHDMVDAEVARLLSRSDERKEHRDLFLNAWNAFKAIQIGKATDAPPVWKNATTLLQTASFMARGREE